MADPIRNPLDYYAHTYGDDMSYWNRNDNPADLPIQEREAWHRSAKNREQIALSGLVGHTESETEAEVFNASMQNGV